MRRSGGGNYGGWLHGAMMVMQMAEALDASMAAAAAQAEMEALRNAPPPDPMAGLAGPDELAGYLFQPGAFPLGHFHPDHGPDFARHFAGVNDDRHLFVKAQTRAGKGVSFLIPAILSWRGGLFAIDPKGEAASICAMRRGSADDARGTGTTVRHFIGQKVAILDPFGVVEGPARVHRVSYNPLSRIDMHNAGGVRDIRSIAAAMIAHDPNEQAFWNESAETFVCGIIEAVMLTEPPERQTLMQCRALLLSGRDPLIGYLRKVDTAAGLAQDAAALMDEVGDDEWGSHRSTLSRHLKWLADPAMQSHLVPSRFSLRLAVQERWSVFVCIPPTEMTAFKAWLRLMVQDMLDAKIALGVNQHGPQTLCVLDEFPALGHFRLIEESAGYLAGYGVKLVCATQTIGQVKSIYKANWETFLGNAGAIIGFALNDLESETYLSNRLGRHMVLETSRSASSGISQQLTGGGSSTGESFSRGWHERPVRFPNEIREQAARQTMRAFVVPADGRGFTVLRVPYTAFPAGLYDAPDFLKQWEQRHLAQG